MSPPVSVTLLHVDEDFELRDAGSLAEHGFAPLLRHLRSGAWSGVAILSRGEEQIGIQLRNGNPSAVSVRGGREPLERVPGAR